MRALNPYVGLDQADSRETARVNAVISREDYDLIMRVSPLHGTIQTLVGLFINNMCNELRKDGNTEYNPVVLIERVQRCSSCGTIATAAAPNVTGPTACIHSKPAPVPDSCDIPITFRPTLRQGENIDQKGRLWENRRTI